MSLYLQLLHLLLHLLLLLELCHGLHALLQVSHSRLDGSLKARADLRGAVSLVQGLNLLLLLGRRRRGR